MAPHSRHFPTKKPKRHVSFRLHNRAAQKNLDSSYFDEINWKIDFQVLLLLTRWRWGWFNYICALELHWIPIQLKVKLGLPIAAVVVEGKNWPHLKIRSTWSDWSFPLLANAYLRSFLHDFSHLHNGYHSTWLQFSKLYHRTLPKVLKDQSRPIICHQQACYWQHHTKLFSRLEAKVTKLQKCLVKPLDQSISCHLLKNIGKMAFCAKSFRNLPKHAGLLW